jgi:hypothetical protein
VRNVSSPAIAIRQQHCEQRVVAIVIVIGVVVGNAQRW